jgi:hypothetical protein
MTQSSNSCNRGYKASQAGPCANIRPHSVEKHHRSWSKELLECPTSSKPFTLSEIWPFELMISPREIAGHIRQVHIANLRLAIPSEHRVDSRRKLRTTHLIYVTGIDPCILPVVQGCLTAALFDFQVSFLSFQEPVLLTSLERRLLRLPSDGEGLRNEVYYHPQTHVG